MNIRLRRRDNGFTLIEVLLYLGLFAMLMGGGVAAAYGMLEISSRAAALAAIDEEGRFLAGKMRWMLAGGDAAAGGIVSPSSGAGSALIVRKPGVAGLLRLAADGSNVELIQGGDPPVILNGSAVNVSGLRFVRSAAAGKLNAVAAAFTLSSSPAGRSVSREFELIIYPRP